MNLQIVLNSKKNSYINPAPPPPKNTYAKFSYPKKSIDHPRHRNPEYPPPWPYSSLSSFTVLALTINQIMTSELVQGMIIHTDKSGQLRVVYVVWII